MIAPKTDLRDRTRRAVAREIADAARALFVKQGYDATTVADIAKLVGISQRSLFRYFATKEDIVLGKVDLVVDQMVAELSARPAGEAPWASLRAALDVICRESDATVAETVVAPIMRMVFDNPGLLSTYLLKLNAAEHRFAAVLRDRAVAAGAPLEAADPMPEALSAAAVGCFIAAQEAWLAAGAGQRLTETLDRCMACIEPAGPGRSGI